MKSKLKYLIPILLIINITACNKQKENVEKPAPLYPKPQSLKLDTTKNYSINRVSGDSIRPIVQENGDTLITGIAINVQGKIVKQDIISKPKIVPLLKPNDTINAHPNIHQIPHKLIISKPIEQDSLTKILLEKIPEKDTLHYLVNVIGDTIKTGVPIELKGKKINTTQPQKTKALAPRFKDAAINNTQYLDVDQGMSFSYLLCSYQDKNGNLWFGTYGGGVSMYDGESFTHFTKNEGLSNDMILTILQDKNGNMWFGTEGGGLNKYDGKSFTHFTTNEGLSNNIVCSILEDKHGNLWFGTWGGGVVKYDGKKWVHYTTKEGLSSNIILSIVEDKKGFLWFGTSNGGVIKHDGKSWTHFTRKDGLSHNSVWSILEDHSGNLWLGTNGGGVNKFDGKQFTHFTTKEGLSNNIVRSIVQDKSGNLWLGTNGGGVNKFNGHSFTHFTINEGLSNDIVRSILEDDSENLWFATWGGGVIKYNPKSFNHFTKKDGLSHNVVLTTLEDKNGNLWFGTDGGGLSMYDGENFIHFTTKNGLSNDHVSSIIEDQSGNLWFGTIGGGVNKFDGQKFTHFTTKNGLSNNSIWSILEDHRGNLWFATAGGGVNKFDGESFTHFTTNEGLSNNQTATLLEDKNGNLWIGTSGKGVTKYDGQSFTHYTTKEGLSNNEVISIFEDRKGNLWFGTWGGGVNMYDGESFTHFTKKEGLNDNIVWSIQEDKNNNIWLSTEKGLNELKFIEYYENEKSKGSKKRTKGKFKINSFEKNDGLKGLDFYINSVCLDSRNRLWWGSGKSLTMLDLNEYNTTNCSPEISLNSLEINQKLIDYRNIQDSLNQIKFSGVPLFKNYPNNLVLPYDQNHLTFHFSAIDWSAPHKIQYSYFMEGISTKWSNPSYETKADYRNIPYGSYNFKVRAIGSSGEWSEPFEYTFEVKPPWWHTWIARIGYGFTALIIVFGFTRWRTAKLKDRQKELETEIKIATEEILEQKEVAERAHKEAELQKKQIEEAHKEIKDSINYAERIQRSFLATDEILNENLNEYFVFYQPKEVVSGDFYWAGDLANGNFAISCADSTGHGVPGAIMSIINISGIEKAVENGFTKAGEIFNQARRTIVDRLKKDGSIEGGKDGMDASLLILNPERSKLEYVAANNPIWIIRDGELINIKAEKMPVGKHSNDHVPFKGGEFELKKGDIIYAMTDGFQDQFGGPKGKKFMVKKMKEYVISISHFSMQEQNEKIMKTFTDWKGEIEQVDDVCIIGVKI